MKKILILNGPNLNRLGKREPSIYGSQTLEDLELSLHADAKIHGVSVECKQSNHEGELVDAIGNAQQNGFTGIIINAGAYTHTSIALRDAISGCGIPAIEVHLSNVYQREEFRHTSHLSPVCRGVIAGFGFSSYLLALRQIATF
jgi:3-dehydroquinate dehydratase-2